MPFTMSACMPCIKVASIVLFMPDPNTPCGHQHMHKVLHLHVPFPDSIAASLLCALKQHPVLNSSDAHSIYLPHCLHHLVQHRQMRLDPVSVDDLNRYHKACGL